MSVNSGARGVRNFNPGNIRRGIDWDGLASIQSDPAFCQFRDMRYGVRALIKILRTYYFKYELDTIHKIIARWAPSSENDTESYAKSVALYLGRGVDEALPLDEHEALFVRLAEAISCHENGISKQDLYHVIRRHEFIEGARMAGLYV